MRMVHASKPSPSAADASAALTPILFAAPHRVLFFGGALAVLTTMAWWTGQLAAMRFGWPHWPQPDMPPGWAHAMLAQYGMLPLFIFGFLLTVFPRWNGQPPVPRFRYVGVAGCVFSGYLLAHIGLLASDLWLIIGFALMAIGYGLAWWTLAGVMRPVSPWRQHEKSCLAALALGTLGLCLFIAFALGAPSTLAIVAIKLGTFGWLLPIYFTVCHRMIPFFSGNVASDYVVRRPAWSLPVVWTLLLAHLVIELCGWPAWLWPVDAALALVFAWHAWAWQPWKARRPGLLLALHLAFAWLPLAFVLYALQSAWLCFAHQAVLGRAPLHVLAIGFFGSMLVAMVTRVTQGHSGRPLQMGVVPWVCFALLQGVVIMRVAAELVTDTYAWLVWAGCGWLIAFLPWVVRSTWIFLTPRLDGQTG